MCESYFSDLKIKRLETNKQSCVRECVCVCVCLTDFIKL